ncbi:MAG: hypothetical protein Q9168_005530 [Polycauliona sp. 1 TL-2023]
MTDAPRECPLSIIHPILSHHISSLGSWPPSLPFRATIRDSSPPAHLDFSRVHQTGSPQEATDFVRLMDEEVDYLQRHPTRQGSGSLIVTRKFTDVMLRCGLASMQWLRLWTFELSLQMLATVGTLVRLNGLREFEFQVTGTGDKVLQNCRIYLKNPFPDIARLAGE